jgi:hypothetical protein
MKFPSNEVDGQLIMVLNEVYPYTKFWVPSPTHTHTTPPQRTIIIWRGAPPYPVLINAEIYTCLIPGQSLT